MPGFDASFVQFGADDLRRDEASWLRELEIFTQLGVHTLFLQFTGNEHGAFDDRLGGVKPVRALLRAAHTRGLNVYVGLYSDPDWPERFDPRRRVAQPLNTESGRQYLHELSHVYPAFAGFYIGNELDEQTWGAADRASQAAAFIADTAAALRRIRADVPIAIAPFYAESAPPARYAEFLSTILAGRPVDIIMLQDGAGARGTSPSTTVATLRALNQVFQAQGVQVWSIVELFHQTAGPPLDQHPFQAVPADVSRICEGIRAQSAHAQRLVAFSVLDYLNPDRGAAQKELYERYRRAVEHGRVR